MDHHPRPFINDLSERSAIIKDQTAMNTNPVPISAYPENANLEQTVTGTEAHYSAYPENANLEQTFTGTELYYKQYADSENHEETSTFTEVDYTNTGYPNQTLTLYVAEPTRNDNSNGNADIYEEDIPLNPAVFDFDLEVSPLIWADDDETKYDEEARLEAERLQDLADAQPHRDDGPCAALSKWMVRNPEYKNILALACTFLLGTKVFKIGPFFHEDAPYESVQEYDHGMQDDGANINPMDTEYPIESRRQLVGDAPRRAAPSSKPQKNNTETGSAESLHTAKENSPSDPAQSVRTSGTQEDTATQLEPNSLSPKAVVIMESIIHDLFTELSLIDDAFTKGVAGSPVTVDIKMNGLTKDVVGPVQVTYKVSARSYTVLDQYSGNTMDQESSQQLANAFNMGYPFDVVSGPLLIETYELRLDTLKSKLASFNEGFDHFINLIEENQQKIKDNETTNKETGYVDIIHPWRDDTVAGCNISIKCVTTDTKSSKTKTISYHYEERFHEDTCMDFLTKKDWIGDLSSTWLSYELAKKT